MVAARARGQAAGGASQARAMQMSRAAWSQPKPSFAVGIYEAAPPNIVGLGGTDHVPQHQKRNHSMRSRFTTSRSLLRGYGRESGASHRERHCRGLSVRPPARPCIVFCIERGSIGEVVDQPNSRERRRRRTEECRVVHVAYLIHQPTLGVPSSMSNCGSVAHGNIDPVGAGIRAKGRRQIGVRNDVGALDRGRTSKLAVIWRLLPSL